MALRYREDLVGKRFLSVSGVSKINVNKVSDWGWKAGVIRAASHKDNKNKELQVKLLYTPILIINNNKRTFIHIFIFTISTYLHQICYFALHCHYSCDFK